MDIPDQLRLIVHNEDTYRQAIAIINKVSQTKVWIKPLWKRVLVYMAGVLFIPSWYGIHTFLIVLLSSPGTIIPTLPLGFMFTSFTLIFTVPLGIFIQLCLWRWDDDQNIVREMQKAVGQANVFMSKEKVLMGCRSNSKIYLVYVSLDRCRQVFEETFSERACSEDMFNRALLFFSSGYTCCLAKKHFPFDTPVSSGHLPRTVCFCQYVRHQLDKGQWLDQ
ncbi:hypothetical protein NL108_017194 [Boleophthalmus pectinirostris]|nr:hypothetical protein NL108_017194 [Boleophthalmus pectinirostris]